MSLLSSISTSRVSMTTLPRSEAVVLRFTTGSDHRSGTHYGATGGAGCAVGVVSSESR